MTLCRATLTDEPVTYWCDRPEGHGGRHEEIWVASWARDDTDLREYVGDTKSGNPVYRPLTRTTGSADPSRCPKCGGPDPFHDPACAVHPDLAQDHNEQE